MTTRIVALLRQVDYAEDTRVVSRDVAGRILTGPDGYIPRQGDIAAWIDHYNINRAAAFDALFLDLIQGKHTRMTDEELNNAPLDVRRGAWFKALRAVYLDGVSQDEVGRRVAAYVSTSQDSNRPYKEWNPLSQAFASLERGRWLAGRDQEVRRQAIFQYLQSLGLEIPDEWTPGERTMTFREQQQQIAQIMAIVREHVNAGGVVALLGPSGETLRVLVPSAQ